jgi:hypothetical protein
MRMQLPNLGRSGQYRRERRSISGHKLLLAVAIVLAIAVTVGMVLRGDPGPGLGVDEWSVLSKTPAK